MKSKDHLTPISGYEWIVIHSTLLGGNPTIKGTRLSVSHILACLAEGMTPEEIATDYEGFPVESIPDVLRFASEHIDKMSKDDVAA